MKRIRPFRLRRGELAWHHTGKISPVPLPSFMKRIRPFRLRRGELAWHHTGKISPVPLRSFMQRIRPFRLGEVGTNMAPHRKNITPTPTILYEEDTAL